MIGILFKMFMVRVNWFVVCWFIFWWVIVDKGYMYVIWL